MRASPELIGSLNKILKIELTSINQFFLHARMHRNWGLLALDAASYKKSIADMKQADKLIERILFLEGLPNLQDLGKLYIGEDTQEALACDMRFQLEQVTALKEAIAFCEAQQDYISRDLLEELLEAEEEHIDWIETQQYLIENAGIENYLQSMISKEQ
ncbi:MAG: bacterioferritin [Halioglobus sp.]